MNNPMNDNESTPVEGEIKEPELIPEVKNEASKEPLIPVVKKNQMQPLKDMGKKMPIGPGNFWNNMLTTVLLLIFVTALFSYLTDRTVKPEELSLTDVVGQVKNGEVKTIVVSGDELDITYNDETRNPGNAKREVDSSVTETLTNLGVSQEQLSKIKIDVQRESGFAYWFGQLAPFLFPLIFLGVVIWFFTRSVKGAGMQALNFGSSKARMIDPNDTSQKVTFKDVAGAKEAKQELEEK